MRRPFRAATALSVLLALGGIAAAGGQSVSPDLAAADFVDLLRNDPDIRRGVLSRVERQWQPSFVPMLLEVLQLVRDPVYRDELFDLLERATGQRRLARSGNDWFEWYWAWDERGDWQHYAEFKSLLYRLIDPRFEIYFSAGRESTVELDEVRWGGVAQNGIPPLHDPKMISADEASYLGRRDVVFGLEVEGDARAYPKRIMGWHEMFTDTVGGVPVAGVYCTLCGSMILFETEVGGERYELGTSGFLYRSNKLMFDEATQSLWNTLWGVPVIGPLVGRGIELPRRSIVTTTWGEWRKRHPDTRVLSLDTGYERDYSEGAAYREYFATDELMFAVSRRDDRLDNKAEVFCLLLGDPEQPLALAAEFLERNPLHQLSHAGVDLVVLTDRSGANRAYRTGGRRFADWNGRDRVEDGEGGVWQVTEDALVGADGARLERLAGHRAFWFGWFAAYPETELVR
ncbi:MAG: DUF3179 domain-containing protein [Acidobacteria bacterium]|nr:MAG: DUF3179 domain-containing protein [Acidobacteriota bacterium]REK08307.1 MAG: DUF3179 domain-containing protein [Acidobacteriota bacterium]